MALNKNTLSPLAQKALAYEAMGLPLNILSPEAKALAVARAGLAPAQGRQPARRPARRFGEDVVTVSRDDLMAQIKEKFPQLPDDFVASLTAEQLSLLASTTGDVREGAAVVPPAFSERGRTTGGMSEQRRRQLLSNTQRGKDLLAKEDVERAKARLFAEELRKVLR